MIAALAFIKPFLPTILVGLLVLAVGASIWGYGHSRYKAGVESMRPALEACVIGRDTAIEANKAAAAALKSLKMMYGDLEKAVKDLEARERAAHIRSDAALAEAARKERVALQEAVRLKKLLETPSATPQEACSVARSVLQEEAARRQTL